MNPSTPEFVSDYRLPASEMVVIHIPNDTIGLLIGKDGRTIQRLQERTGARIQVTRDDDTNTGSPTRPVTITGPRYITYLARQEILNLIATQSSHGLQSMVGQIVHLDILIPNHSVGILIGKAGQTIRDLQIQTGAKVQVTKDDDVDPSVPFRTVSIIGDPIKVEMARQAIDALVCGFPGIPDGDLVEEDIRIPLDLVGLLIGKSGQTIKTLQVQCQTKIQIARFENTESGTRRVILTGTKENIQKAKIEIAKLLESVLDDQPVRNTVVARMRIPVESVPLLIGSGGETILHLSNMSKAEIKVVPLGNPMYQEVQISGTADAVDRAASGIHTVITRGGIGS